MGIYLGFVFFWLGVMALIGIALWLVSKIGKRAEAKEKEQNKDEIQDIADE